MNAEKSRYQIAPLCVGLYAVMYHAAIEKKINRLPRKLILLSQHLISQNCRRYFAAFPINFKIPSFNRGFTFQSAILKSLKSAIWNTALRGSQLAIRWLLN